MEAGLCAPALPRAGSALNFPLPRASDVSAHWKYLRGLQSPLPARGWEKCLPRCLLLGFLLQEQGRWHCPVPGVAPTALGPRGKGIFGGAVPGGRSRGWGDRAAALGHYTIPLKRDMQPTGVGRNLQICGDPGLCSLAVNMIYSKPFPDGTIKTRGSGFVSVSWSHWGAGRTGAGGVARAARASGTSCRGQPRPRLRAGLPRAPGMLGVGAAPTTGVFGAG